MPLIDDFHKRHAGDARVQALAFHDPQASSLEDLEQKLARVPRSSWDGRRLAVPVLIDAGGNTVRDYGIDEYPTVVLIGPDGNVVRAGNEALLPEILEEMEARLSRNP